MVELSFNCPEAIHEMKRTKNGLRCETCVHTIIDFSEMTNAEIRDILSRKEEKVCGVFKAGQVRNRQKSFVEARFKLAFTAVFLFGLSSNIFAQNETDVIRKDSLEISQLQSYKLVGRVIDNQTKEPMIGCKISVKSDSLKSTIGAVSDINGKYQLEVKGIKGDSLVVKFEYISFETTEHTFVLGEILTEDELIVKMNVRTDLMIIGLVVPHYRNSNSRGRIDPHNRVGTEEIEREDLEY